MSENTSNELIHDEALDDEALDRMDSGLRAVGGFQTLGTLGCLAK